MEFDLGLENDILPGKVIEKSVKVIGKYEFEEVRYILYMIIMCLLTTIFR